jgi:two-component system chemotaxis sensor kinase CheA
MQPMEVTFHKLPRIIRDLERATGKKINLLVEGGDIELDKTLIDSLGDPLMHIIRNSVDHGIESVDERLRTGKPEAGHLHVKAMLKAGNVTIFIQDDGRGIDLSRITEKAIEKGIVSAEGAENLADHEVIELIFHPGFSTAEQVTQVSGRGVGMDVVRSNIQKIGGTVSIKTEAGRGTLMTINLPQTLSIITSLVVSSGEHRLAVPQQNLERLILLHHNQLMENKGKLFIRLAGQLIPVFNMLDILSPSEEIKPLHGDSSHLIIVQSDGQKAGLILDEIINSEEIVIKPLGSMYSGAQLFSGAAVLGDGSAVLILDIQGFYRFVNYTSTNAELISERISESVEQDNELKKLRYVVFEVNTKQFAFEVDGSCRIIKLNQSNNREVLEKKSPLS